MNEYKEDLDLVEETIAKIVNRLFERKNYVELGKAIYDRRDLKKKCVTLPYFEVLIQAVAKKFKETQNDGKEERSTQGHKPQ